MSRSDRVIKISPDVSKQKGDLAEVVNEYLNDYLDEVKELLEQVSKEVAAKTAKKIRNEFKPLNVYPQEKGYAESWTYSKDDEGDYIVHAGKFSWLAHLVEYGHVVRNGTGKNSGATRTRANPHISPAEVWAKNEFVKRVTEELEKLDG